jgi:hypothetical protein
MRVFRACPFAWRQHMHLENIPENIFIVLFLAFSIVWSKHDGTRLTKVVKSWIEPFATQVGLAHNWRMFSVSPFAVVALFHVRRTYADGTTAIWHPRGFQLLAWFGEIHTNPKLIEPTMRFFFRENQFMGGGDVRKVELVLSHRVRPVRPASLFGKFDIEKFEAQEAKVSVVASYDGTTLTTAKAAPAPAKPAPAKAAPAKEAPVKATTKAVG